MTRVSDACPCDSGRTAESCCLPVIRGVPADTAEALMRSRYTAFTLGETDYLLKSWSAATRPPRVEIDPDQRWLGLKIKRIEAGGPDDTEGVVEFVARYKIDGRGFRLHETSRFRKESGQWVYVDGVIAGN